MEKDFYFKKSLRFFIILILILFIGCRIGSFTKEEKIFVWVIGDCYKVNPQNGKVFNPFVRGDYKHKNFLWDSSTRTVTLYGARNEYLAFQIIIEAKDDLENVDLVATDLKGPSLIPSQNIKFFKEWYVKVDRESKWPKPTLGKGEYPDALIPFDIPNWGAPFSVRKGRNQAVWVDVYIPKDIKPGKYKGMIAVIGKNFKSVPVEVELTVWNFTLPAQTHLKAWTNYFDLDKGYGVSMNSEEYLEIEKNVMRLCHEHRVEALYRHVPIRPELEDGLGDSVIVDWTSYDKRLGGFLSGSIFKDKKPPAIFLLPVNTWPSQRWPKDEFVMQQVCQEIVKHFKEKEWDLSRGYIYLWDEPTKKELDEVKKWAKLIKDTTPELKTMIALLHNFNSETVKKLSPYIDLWLVDASKANIKLFKKLKEKGKEVGFYQQGSPWCGNENLDSDGLAFRTWPWIAAKYNLDCIYLYTATNWWRVQDKGTIWENPHNVSWSNSQGVLLYPGGYINTKRAIASIRLKQLRRGMQDYEYIYLAKSLGKDPSGIINSIIKRALSETQRGGGSWGEWSYRPSDWFIARKKLAYLIMGKKFKEEEIPFFGRVKKYKPKKTHKKIIFFDDFEEGDIGNWEGARLEENITFGNSKYALRGVYKSGDYIFLEKWQKFRIDKDTYLEFAYWCQNADEIIINLWSNKHHRNYSIVIHNPPQKEWVYLRKKIEDFGSDIGKTINSIHIAIPKKEGAKIIIDNVELFKER